MGILDFFKRRRKDKEESKKQLENEEELERRLETELYLEDYMRAAGIYHELKQYDNELKMFVLDLRKRLQKSDFFFAENDINKINDLIYRYGDKINKDLYAEIKRYLKNLEVYVRNKKELRDKLEDIFGRYN